MESASKLFSNAKVEIAPQVPGGPPYLLHVSDFKLDDFELVFNSDWCLAVSRGQSVGLPEEDMPGVFCYEDCDPEHGTQGPYFRSTAPRYPLKVEDLPSGFQSAVNQVHFKDLKFMDSPFIQPMDHFECSKGWDYYVDVDGKTVRSRPGVTVDNLEEYQREWDQTTADYESKRSDRMRDFLQKRGKREGSS